MYYSCIWSTALSVVSFPMSNVWHGQMIIFYSWTSYSSLNSSSFDCCPDLLRTLCAKFNYNFEYQVEAFEVIVWDVFSKILLNSFRAPFSAMLHLAQLLVLSLIWVFFIPKFQKMSFYKPITVFSRQKRKKSKYHILCPR